MFSGKSVQLIARVLGIGAFFIFLFFPIYWTITVSFKPEGEYFSRVPHWVPKRPTLSHYKEVIFPPKKVIEKKTAVGVVSVGQIGTVLRFAYNSLLIAGGSVLLSLLLAIPAAYALARFDFRAKDNLLFYILSTRMFPPIALAIPLFLLYRDIKLLDTHLGMILIYTVFNLSFAIWMLKGFFQDIPKEIEESGLLDGCTQFSVLWRVLLPLVAPGVAATMVFCFVLSWNEFLFALLLTRAQATTLPVALAGFKDLRGIMWGQMAAASMFCIVPLLIFTFAVQKYLVRGLTFGAMKG